MGKHCGCDFGLLSGTGVFKLKADLLILPKVGLPPCSGLPEVVGTWKMVGFVKGGIKIERGGGGKVEGFLVYK